MFSVGEKLIITIDKIGNKTINAIGTTSKTHPQLEGRLAGTNESDDNMAGFKGAVCFVSASMVILSGKHLKN